MKFPLVFLAGLVGLFSGASSLAQAGIGVVGYINISLVPGFTLVSFPLMNTSQSVSNVFSLIRPDRPAGLRIFFLDGDGYKSGEFDPVAEAFEPAAINQRIVSPGEAVFVFNPSTNMLTLTVVGRLQQGVLITPLRAGLSLVSSRVPQEGTPAELGLEGEQGDSVHFWNAAEQRFQTSVFDDVANNWIPPLAKLRPAEGFVLRKRNAGQEWVREFYANR